MLSKVPFTYVWYRMMVVGNVSVLRHLLEWNYIFEVVKIVIASFDYPGLQLGRM